MREYGFRVYNPRDKKMHYDITGFEFLDSSNMSGVFIDGGFYLKEEVYIMQYTGLHDKNGKEIYEGDIVKGTFYGFLMPEYDYVFQIYWDEKEKGFRASYFEPRECEVIGNIYENPELLKGES